ncbi:MAG: PAS domain S-box protein [Bacteroidetes bacterium]|nr:MAG: PAS domain S-box protein [Bacteroidota bacterium]
MFDLTNICKKPKTLKIPMIKKALLSAFIILVVIFPSLSAIKAENNILILHSYHPSFQWNIEINQGITDVLERELADFNIVMEYMDSKRLFDTSHQEKLLALYRYKFSNAKFDAIILSDDDALQFMYTYGEQLFPSVPVVFCGINNYNPGYREKFPLFTGVLEKLDKPETVALALKLFPKTQQIYFIGDQSTTALDLTTIFREKYENLFKDIRFHYIHKNRLSDLTDVLSDIPAESLVMLWPYLHQKESQLIEVEKATRYITSASKVPVFGFWHFMLNNGILGGKLVNGYTQGEIAAKMAVRILNGEAPENIPVKESVPNNYYFDYQTLKAFGLSPGNLPENSIIVSIPESFLSQNKNILFGFLLAMLIFVIIYIVYTIHNRNIRRLLENELNFQQTLINALPNPVFYSFDNKHIEGSNQAFEKLTGINRDPNTRTEFQSLYIPGQTDLHKAINEEILLNRRQTTYEGKIIGKENNIRDVIFYKSVLYNSRTKKHGIIETIIDITEKKNATERIRLSEERYALATRATKDGIWDWDLKKNEVYLSDNLKEMLGYELHEEPFNTRNMHLTVHPEDLNIFNHQMDLLHQGVKDSYILEMRLKRKNGTYFWTEVKTFAQRDKNNEIFRHIGSISNIQHRKDTEFSLLRWEEIFRNTLMGVCVVNHQSKKIELMNPVFARIHGYQPEELKGKTISDLRSPDAPEDTIEIFDKADRLEQYVLESVHERRDNSRFPVMIDITAVKNHRDKLQYYIINLQDITQRKKQEYEIAQMLKNEQSMNEELRSSEEEVRQTLQQTVNLKENLEENQKQFLSFIDGASDFAILKDQNLRYLMVNKAFADFYHLTPAQIIEKTDHEFAPESIAREEQEMDMKVIQENLPVIYERENDGFIFETRKFPVYYNNNQIGLGAFIRDITRQRIVEQQVQENEQRFKTLLENSYDLITLLDKNGVISYCTDAINSLTGFSNIEVTGNHFSQYIHPEERTLFLQKLEKLVQSGNEPLHIHHRFSHNTSGYKNIETIATNHLRNPLINAIVLTSRDVSLEHQSRELKKNISIAQKSAEIKQQFLANMSHEIRTPMNGIVGMIEFLMKTTLDHTQLDYVQTIKSSADSLLNIINDILDFSKIEAGKLSINPTPVNIRRFAEEAAKIFAALVKQKQLEFVLFVDESIPEYLNIDPIRLNQVLSNLLSNAIKFTPSGVVTLRILPDKITNDTVNLRIEVQDTGIGLTEQEQERLFTPFTQIDSSLTRSQEGTGLGLTISQRIMELMGGEIGIISNKEKGALFWVTLPAEISELEKVKNFIQKHEVGKKKPLGIHVLLVEDKVVNQKVFKLMLESMGCAVTIASDGQQAISLIENHKKNDPDISAAFQIILMDIQMPVMDGVTATKIIRSKHPEYKIIIGLSANVFTSEVEGFLRSGLDDYIVKPAKSDELYKKLLYWSEKRETQKKTPGKYSVQLIDKLTKELVFERHSLDIIKAQSENNSMVLQELFSSFYADALELVSNIESELEKEDNKAMDYLNTLQNIARSMGAMQISKTCEALSENLKHPTIPHEKIIEFLRESIQRFVSAIKDAK